MSGEGNAKKTDLGKNDDKRRISILFQRIEVRMVALSCGKSQYKNAWQEKGGIA